jgi:predicted DNA-binding transcriptional regulator AlpA
MIRQRVEYVGLREIAQMCGYSYWTVWSWSQEEGKLPPHVGLGRRKRWVRANVVEWLRARGVPVPEE